MEIGANNGSSQRRDGRIRQVPSTPTEVRAAKNESVFRELNEHLEAAARGDDADTGGFVCECADIACTAVLAIPLVDYEAIRQHADRFVVAPDDTHVNTTVEHVVEHNDGFWVVQKHGAAGDIAAALDPRD